MTFCYPRRCIGIFLALLMVGLALPAKAQEQRTAEIVVTGNNVINQDAILGGIALKVGDLYTQEAADSARKSIEGLGYFSAVSMRTEQVPDGVRVIFDVVENPVVKEIKVIGNEPLPAQKVLDRMRLKAGQVLNTRTLDLDVQDIQKLYEEEGYIAFVTEDIQIDKNTGVLTIPILVHKVESINIVGNRKTMSYVFLREMKLRPGDYFNSKVLEADIRRIWNLDILEEVERPKYEPGSEIGRVKVTIPVKEKKTGQVSIGLGYSSRQRLVGRMELSETNLRGSGQGLNLLWENSTTGGVGGGSSYEVGYFLPWIDKKHTSLSINGYNKLLYRFTSSVFGGGTSLPAGTPQYTERHKGGSGTVSRPLSEFTRLFLTLRGETVDTPTDLINSQISGIAEDGDVRSAELKLTANTRDFDLDPAVGGYKSTSVELGRTDGHVFTSIDPVTGLPLAQPIAEPNVGSYRKLQVDRRWYFSKAGRKMNPKDKRRTFAVRLIGGVAGGTLPFFEQFFVGGAESLRGYREDRFWGERMLLMSAEYRVPVAQSLKGVLFVDYGDAWGSARRLDGTLPQDSSFKAHIGTGLGIRVATPIGNLRLDYGFGSEGARTHFSIGQAF